MLVASLLLACWRPAPWTPPPPPEEARAALGLAAAPDEAGSDEPDAAPEGTRGPQDDEEPGATKAPGAPPTPPPAPQGPIEAWTAVVTTAPATVVDDDGKAVCVLHGEKERVTVLASDSIRARVRHPDCPAEGWLQVTMVRRP